MLWYYRVGAAVIVDATLAKLYINGQVTDWCELRIKLS